MNWYDTLTGGNLLVTGNSYSTPSLTSTTNYWVSTSKSSIGNVGLPAPISTSGNTEVGIRLTIDVCKIFTISAKSSIVSGFIKESSTSAFSFPYVLADVCSLGTTTSGYYYYLYNLNISSNCESDRTQITATVDNACLGTAETKLAKKLVLYPNPFINILNIDNPSLIKLLQVLDHSGKLIKTINAPNSSLQLDDLPSGVYLIILDMNNGSKQSSKVIKK
ncbi:T9SS C-terminal target domain-containing protein [Chryseobacterium balustinum]|nr:T9SS C-terminal target domain-containing protein [Chryseobacterium balustinum]